MRVKMITWLAPALACAAVAFTPPRRILGQQAAAAKIPDVTGSWERYRGATQRERASG